MATELKQNYELAFHINANLEEAAVQKTKQDIDSLITSNKGVISFSKEPEIVRFSYPINHQNNAYFGYLHFDLEAKGNLENIREELKLNANVIRFLMIKKDEEKVDQKDVVRKIAMEEKRRMRTAQLKVKKETKKEPAIKEEEIDKKLEDILEKI
jgi:ribosomal protein S6